MKEELKSKFGFVLKMEQYDSPLNDNPFDCIRKGVRWINRPPFPHVYNETNRRNNSLLEMPYKVRKNRQS